MTKNIIGLFLVLTVASVSSVLLITSAQALQTSDCEDLQGCKKKICEIEKQLNISKDKGNKHKTKGLKTALNNAKKNCTDRDLKDDLVEEITIVEKEIVEYENELKEAKEYKKADKIIKYQNKIKEKTFEIKSLKDELSKIDS